MDEACHVEPIQIIVTVIDEQQATALILLGLQGMGRPNCAARVHSSLLALNGVIEAEVNDFNGTACVEFNPCLVTMAALCEAVAGADNDGRHWYRAFSLSDAIVQFR